MEDKAQEVRKGQIMKILCWLKKLIHNVAFQNPYTYMYVHAHTSTKQIQENFESLKILFQYLAYSRKLFEENKI